MMTRTLVNPRLQKESRMRTALTAAFMVVLALTGFAQARRRGEGRVTSDGRTFV